MLMIIQKLVIIAVLALSLLTGMFIKMVQDIGLSVQYVKKM